MTGSRGGVGAADRQAEYRQRVADVLAGVRALYHARRTRTGEGLEEWVADPGLVELVGFLEVLRQEELLHPARWGACET